MVSYLVSRTKLGGLLLYWFLIKSPERSWEACCFTCFLLSIINEVDLHGFLLSLLNEIGRLVETTG